MNHPSPTQPMLAALRFAAKERMVRAWPDDILDGTIRRLRLEGYLTTYETTGPLNCCGMTIGYKIEDELSAKGRTAISPTGRLRRNEPELQNA